MVSLSLDAWTSGNGYAFLAIVMHYVDDNWETRKSPFRAPMAHTDFSHSEELLIDFRELLGEHSGENFASVVWETLELYGLVGRVSNRDCLRFDCVH